MEELKIILKVVKENIESIKSVSRFTNGINEELNDMLTNYSTLILTNIGIDYDEIDDDWYDRAVETLKEITKLQSFYYRKIESK